MAQTINKKNTDKRKIKIERPMTPEEQAAADKAAEVRNSADRIAQPDHRYDEKRTFCYSEIYGYSALPVQLYKFGSAG